MHVINYSSYLDLIMSLRDETIGLLAVLITKQREHDSVLINQISYVATKAL